MAAEVSIVPDKMDRSLDVGRKPIPLGGEVVTVSAGDGGSAVGRPPAP
jgi:hypothetical protein